MNGTTCLTQRFKANPGLELANTFGVKAALPTFEASDRIKTTEGKRHSWSCINLFSPVYVLWAVGFFVFKKLQAHSIGTVVDMDQFADRPLSVSIEFNRQLH